MHIAQHTFKDVIHRKHEEKKLRGVCEELKKQTLEKKIYRQSSQDSPTIKMTYYASEKEAGGVPGSSRRQDSDDDLNGAADCPLEKVCLLLQFFFKNIRSQLSIL